MQNKASANSKVAQAPSTANAVPLPLGGRLMLVCLGRANTVRPYTQEILCGGNPRTVADAGPYMVCVLFLPRVTNVHPAEQDIIAKRFHPP